MCGILGATICFATYEGFQWNEVMRWGQTKYYDHTGIGEGSFFFMLIESAVEFGCRV
jgi:hypothetical protein